MLEITASFQSSFKYSFKGEKTACHAKIPPCPLSHVQSLIKQLHRIY